MQASMLAWVVTYWVHSTILVLGAWLLERRWGDRPERMSAVWKTALVGGFVTATVQLGLGIAPMAGRVDLTPVLASREPGPSVGVGAVVASERGDAPVVASVGREVSPSWPPPDAVVERGRAVGEDAVVGEPVLAGAPVMPPEREPMLAVASVRAVPAPSSPSEATLPSSRAAAFPASATSRWAAVVPWIMGVLVLGALLGLASVMVAFVALREQLAGRRKLAEGTLPSLLEGLRQRAGIERPIRLTVAPRVQVPMAVGVLRPEIVVPIKAAQGLPPAHQESLLAHELAHVLRRDPAWRLAALLVERVFFFQPLNRLASRRVAQSAEYLCDDWAARHTRQPLALATCLTEIATWVARTGPVPATMAGPRSILGRRVQRLLQPSRASARPWWLSAALGLPLLAMVAVAPGVGAHAKGDRHRSAPERIVVIDEDGRRHELRPHEGGAIVVQQRDGELMVRSLGGEGAAAPVAVSTDGSPREARKAIRQQERARNDARSQARKDLRRAFRAAKERGEAAPSRAEVEAILRRARVADGSHPEGLELHVVVPGELELHGHVPVDVEAIEAGVEEALEGLEGLEELGPALEQLQQQLEGMNGLEEIQEELEAEGIDVVRLHRADAHQREAMQAAMRARQDALRHRGQHTRHEAAAARERAERDAERLERDAERLEHDAVRIEREELRRQIERARRDQQRRAPSELPTVRAPAPGAPVVWAFGAPNVPPAPPAPIVRVRRIGMPVPAAAPRAPRPPRFHAAPFPPSAPAAPSAPVAPSAPAAPPAPPSPSDVGPVVWSSWPPPTTTDSLAFC